MVSDFTYDLRSGSPDFVDLLVAFTFAGTVMDALAEGKSGLMTAINEGRYTMVPIPNPKLGPCKVDLASMYNTHVRPQARPADFPDTAVVMGDSHTLRWRESLTSALSRVLH